MKLIKKRSLTPMAAVGAAGAETSARKKAMDRRTFLRRSGLTIGGAAVGSMLPLTMIRRAHAQEAEVNPPKAGVKVETRRSVCTHCSVGCGIIAEIQNGVWTGQEPDFDSPLNLGSNCPKGASVRGYGLGARR